MKYYSWLIFLLLTTALVAQVPLYTQYQKIDVENGLTQNLITGVLQDKDGFIWISTNKGITRFNPLEEIFTNDSIADGLIENEFNRHLDFVFPDGRIAMGGTNGYTVFDSLQFKEDTNSPEVFITGFSVNEKPVDTKSDSIILPSSINLVTEVNLSYENNSIAFEIATTQFNAPEKNKYRYRLNGYNRNWVEIEGEQKIRFTQLPYGRYELLLNASNTTGVWSPHVRRLAIIVRPPFWLTWWAYAFYMFVIGVGIRLYWRGYNKRVRAKQEAAFNIREAVRLREVDEIKTQFFSNITHEFRTPLTMILSPLEKYLRDETQPSRAHTLLNNNYRHATQLLELVNQLLDIAKIEAGQMPLNPTAGELKTFAMQFADAFIDLTKKKRIDLQCSVENVDGYYLFDQEKWGKIIQNLVSNAVKFTPQGGSVYFSVTGKNHSDHPIITIQVRDTGVGIRKELLAKIFERFYQVDDSTTRKHEGTGIGLSLVKELVELLKGTIEVESELHKGTVFTIQLPAAKLREIPQAIDVCTVNNSPIASEETVLGVDHEVPLILIVEDNDELRSFVKESLAANWNVLEASNGLDGWNIIEQELPEIVVSDVMMLGINGFELCSKAKHDPRTCHINFIMLTAKAAQESKIEGLESGADEYLTKPFHLYELELRIRNLLQEQHSLRNHLREKLLPGIPVNMLPHVSDLFLTKLHTCLDNNLDNTSLKVETVAEAMAMSKSTLNRKLRALLNISVNEYIRQYRLQKATILLSSGHTVSEVSDHVGFETASYFAQCFKEYYKQTPTEFIKGSN